MNFETTEEAQKADAKGELWSCYLKARRLPEGRLYHPKVNALDFIMYQGPPDPNTPAVLRSRYPESPVAGPFLHTGKMGDVAKKVIDTFGPTHCSFEFYYDESRPR